MKIQPKAGPTIMSPPQSTARNESGIAARERAIALLSAAQQPKIVAPPGTTVKNDVQRDYPVSNPNKISPEESSVVRPPAQSTSPVEGQPDKSETPVAEEVASAAAPEAPKVEDKEDPLSTQYANLARKEKALRAKALAQENALKQREEAIKAREEQIKTKEASYGDGYIQKDRLTQDTLSVLAENGISYDQLTEMALNQSQQDPMTKHLIGKLEAELKTIRENQERAQKASEDQQKNSYQQAVNQIRTEAKALITSDANFETIKETGSVDDVVDLIEKTFQEDGILLSVEDAAREVEEYLVEEALKITRLKKIQQRLNSTAKTETESSPKQVETKAPEAPQMKTLTNSMATSRQLSRRERALAAFKGEKF